MQAKQLYMPFMSYILLIKHVTASSGINYALIRWDAANNLAWSAATMWQFLNLPQILGEYNACYLQILRCN